MSDRVAPASERGRSLTELQRELLRSAAREGYFEVPRRVSLVDLASEHGMSDREASEQLRRGLDIVVRDATLED
jgi:predicted DNA binding protein